MIEEESLIWIMIILVISTLLIIGMSYNSYDKVISRESSCHIRPKNSNLSSENLSAHAIPVYRRKWGQASHVNKCRRIINQIDKLDVSFSKNSLMVIQGQPRLLISKKGQKGQNFDLCKQCSNNASF